MDSEIRDTQRQASNDESTIEEEPAPSLDLAFERVKDVLHNQVQQAEAYNTRITMLLSVATAIVGIGFPIILTQVPKFLDPTWSLHFTLSILAITSYSLIVLTGIYGLWLRSYDTLDNPKKIREQFWELSHDEFREQILGHMENAFKTNESNLKKKIYPMQMLVGLLGVETICLVLALLLALL